MEFSLENSCLCVRHSLSYCLGMNSPSLSLSVYVWAYEISHGVDGVTEEKSCLCVGFIVSHCLGMISLSLPLSPCVWVYRIFLFLLKCVYMSCVLHHLIDATGCVKFLWGNKGPIYTLDDQCHHLKYCTVRHSLYHLLGLFNKVHDFKLNPS